MPAAMGGPGRAARVAWKVGQERAEMAARLAAEKRAILERGRG